jgi:hypothetical protein
MENKFRYVKIMDKKGIRILVEDLEDRYRRKYFYNNKNG